MAERLGIPFPDATEGMQSAYYDAAYVQIGHQAGVDPQTGELIFSSYHGTDEQRAEIGTFMTGDEFYVPRIHREDEKARLNLTFMMGYMSAMLAVERGDRV